MLLRSRVAETVGVLSSRTDFKVPLLAMVIFVAFTDQVRRKVMRLFWFCYIYIRVLVEKMSKRSGTGFWLSNDKNVD